MKNEIHIRRLTYEYECRIKHLERIIMELENELHKKEFLLKKSSKTSKSSPNSKRQEIVDAINYIKSKPHKTKQDRDSLYSLEMVLKNMKD